MAAVQQLMSQFGDYRGYTQPTPVLPNTIPQSTFCLDCRNPLEAKVSKAGKGYWACTATTEGSCKARELSGWKGDSHKPPISNQKPDQRAQGNYQGNQQGNQQNADPGALVRLEERIASLQSDMNILATAVGAIANSLGTGSSSKRQKMDDAPPPAVYPPGTAGTYQQVDTD